MTTDMLRTALYESADDLDARSTVTDAMCAARMRDAADRIAELERNRDFWQAKCNRLQMGQGDRVPTLSEYNTEEDAITDIARHVEEDRRGLARNRLAAHARQVANISANAEQAVILVEQAEARCRLAQAERQEIIDRIKSWCRSNGVPESVVA